MISPGKTFGHLTAIEPAPALHKNARWFFKCVCSKIVPVALSHVNRALKRKYSLSCGCQRKIQAGLTQKEYKTYLSWRCMIRRCYDPAHIDYSRYGGRGVTVYFEWMGPGGFARFFKDVGRRPHGKTLGRKHVNDHYEPDTVTWETPEEQYFHRDTQRWAAKNLRLNNP